MACDVIPFSMEQSHTTVAFVCMCCSDIRWTNGIGYSLLTIDVSSAVESACEWNLQGPVEGGLFLKEWYQTVFNLISFLALPLYAESLNLQFLPVTELLKLLSIC